MPLSDDITRLANHGKRNDSERAAEVAAAEGRLARIADGQQFRAIVGTWANYDDVTADEALKADLRLILSELSGLKQFDPR